jgi:hypothetical protein
MKKYKSLSRPTIEKICRDVCSRFQPWGSLLIDIDALYFSLYWQISVLQNKRIDLEDKTESKMHIFREELEILFNGMTENPTEVMNFVDEIVDQAIVRHYRQAIISSGC